MQPRSWELTLLRVETDLNLENSACVKEILTPLLSRPGDVVLDLRGARLDSSGLGTILSIQRQLELKDRRLMVVATDPQFLALLDRAGARGALSLFPDAEQAANHVRERRQAAGSRR